MNRTSLARGLIRRPVDDAVRLICLSHLQTARAALARVGDPSDLEALHDFRVAVRRLRSTLRAYRDELEDPIPRKLRRRLRDFQQRTNAGRDAEVELEWLQGQRSALTARQRRGFDWLHERLTARRSDAYIGAAEHVARGFTKTADALEKRLTRYRHQVQVGSTSLGTPLAAVAARLLREHCKALEDHLGQIADPNDQAAVHTARIAAKRLRYLLEPLRVDLESAAPLVKQLKLLQDILGEIHDSQVFERDLAESLELAAAEWARRLYEAAAQADRAALRPAAERDERPGLLALVERAALWRSGRFAELASHWLGGRAASLLADVEALAEEADAAAGAHLETERKYLLTETPPKARNAPCVEIQQGWLPGEVLQERLRRIRSPAGEQFKRTVKHGNGVTRLELEEDATPDLFEALWPLTKGRRVAKRRYSIPDGGLDWEIDEFADRQLVLAEVELPTDETEVSLPEWLAPYVKREVTGEPEFVNVNLAR